MSPAADAAERRPDRLKFEGRTLYLTEETSLIRRQLEAGEDLEYDPERPLMNNISTDEITPGWVCFYYDETLGEYVYVGMREGAVKKDEVKQGGFGVEPHVGKGNLGMGSGGGREMGAHSGRGRASARLLPPAYGPFTGVPGLP